MIVQLTPEEVLRTARGNLRIAPPTTPNFLDDEFIAASLRRLAGFHCPCSPSTLCAALLESLDCLVSDRFELQRRVEHVLEAMHVVGDLLELSQVAVAEDSTPRTWVFAAPPSFVARTDRIFNIFGLTAEDSAPLPLKLKSRLRVTGASRVLIAEDGEEIRAQLIAAGFQEQSIETWLRLPAKIATDEYRRRVEIQLSARKTCGDIDGLRVIDTSRHELPYRKRWTTTAFKTGRYVCRRAQAYGADLWGYVELTAGHPTKLLDFPLSGSAARGCDEAWRLQMALDQVDGHPQVFRAIRQVDGTALIFDWPLPLWAVRRLEVTGERISANGGLLEFLVSDELASEEIEYLTSSLGLENLII